MTLHHKNREILQTKILKLLQCYPSKVHTLKILIYEAINEK
jgi:hypothetical protein